jgi:hypothetical protein
MNKQMAGILTAALLLASCTGGDGNANPTASTATTTASATATTTPSPSPSTTSAEDQAAQHAEAVYRDYLRAQITCFTNPRATPSTCFDAVAIGPEKNTSLQALRAAQEVNSKVSGDIAVLSIKTTKVDLTNKVSQTPPIVPEVVFRACEDLSNLNIVDKDGKSIVPPSRKPHVLVDVSVLNYQLPDPTQWRVGRVTEVKDATC